MNKLLYIKTFGCQMNVYDSRQIVNILSKIGYYETSIIENADLIILNTCEIRNKAEQKAFSFLGQLKKLKKFRPSFIIAIGGCIAQNDGRKILRRFENVDLVFGTNAIFRLSVLVLSIEKLRCKIVDIGTTNQNEFKENFSFEEGLDKKFSKFVTIVRGCDNYCTYCVVPYVRGREISRCPEDILREIKKLVTFGAREIVLLGQNVNSYGKKEGLISFPQLLKKINEIDELERIRFITSHPKDLSNELIDVFLSIDKLCKHIHLPVQSGNNEILKRMNRKYTIEDYLDKVERLRSKCPNISITSDIIVGFPGESEKQFAGTIKLIKQVKFDSLFVFSYSDRPNAFAAKLLNKVSKKEKLLRLQKILRIQRTISINKNRSMIGSIQYVFIERLSNLIEKNNKEVSQSFLKNKINKLKYLSGKTSTNKVVFFKITNNISPFSLQGRIVKVIIKNAEANFLSGELL